MTSSAKVFARRSLRIYYWNCESKVLDSYRMSFEIHLKRLGDLETVQIESLDDPAIKTADLLVIGAHLVEIEHFSTWLRGVRNRLIDQGAIWTPVLVLSETTFESLLEILLESIADNWYFDIIAPRHLASLPIRVANLIRIHDHLHELRRYSQALEDINQKVVELEKQLIGVSRG
jgi:hypothetical protein